MAFPRNSISAFLQHAKKNLIEALKGRQKINIVIGNESADLDSLSSSLLYAYIRSVSSPQNGFASFYVPLLNIPSSGIRLRPEFRAVCDHANISTSSLITLDDFQLDQKPLDNVRWMLVDHNKLQGALGERYSANVHGVIDHHEEEHAVLQDTGPEPRIIEKCGSCTSLVVRYCQQPWSMISSSSMSSGAAQGQGDSAIDDDSTPQTWDAQIAKLALASILIDTANLTAPGKVHDVDKDAVKYLEATIQASPKFAKDWSRDGFYKEVDEAKRNIDSLTLDEILSKDYKQWTENGMQLGISSAVKPLEFLAHKGEHGFEGDLDRFMNQRKLSIFAIMTTSTASNGDFRREIIVQTNDHGHSAHKRFAEHAVSALQLEETDFAEISTEQEPKPGQMWRRTWLQKDVSQSRKQVAPLLREAMR